MKRATLQAIARVAGNKLSSDEIEAAVKSDKEVDAVVRAVVSELPIELECAADHRVTLTMRENGKEPQTLMGKWSCVGEGAWFSWDNDRDGVVPRLDYRAPHMVLSLPSTVTSMSWIFSRE